MMFLNHKWLLMSKQMQTSRTKLASKKWRVYKLIAKFYQK